MLGPCELYCKAGLAPKALLRGRDTVRFIDGWNERCHPFVWTKTADELLDHCHPGQKNIVYATLVSCVGDLRDIFR